MINHLELINLSNATHNGTSIPSNWKPLNDDDIGFKEFGPITTQAYINTLTKKVVLTIKGTDGDLEDWTVVNQSFSTGDFPTEIKGLLKHAHDLNVKYGGAHGTNMSVTGFSQGGGLSELLSHTFGWSGNAQNAPDAGYIVENESYLTYLNDELKIEAKGVPETFVTITESGDVVDDFGKHLGSVVEINITDNNAGVLALIGLVPHPLFQGLALLLSAEDTVNQHDIQKLADHINSLDENEKTLFIEKLENAVNEDNSLFLENPDFSKVTTTAINQIGSLIISNNDFSNIEEISITASVATLADYAIYEEAKEFKTTEEGFENLKGAVASFAISSYFAKNDNISDLIGADGTFLRDFSKCTSNTHYTNKLAS